jgi:hypothetical protein
MWKRTILIALAAAVVVTIVGAGLAYAQEPERERDRGGRRGPPRDPEEMRRRFEEFRQRMSERMREQLGATEDEWKILEPRIEKVREAQRDMRGGGFRMMRGMFGRGRGRRGDDDRRDDRPERERSDIEQKTEALRSLLDDENASPSSIKAALGALRQARQKAEQDLEAARKELRQVCSMKQEAQLVLMGVLE